MHGTREGATVIYKHDQYPKGAIGEVSFLWKPAVVSENEPECMDVEEIAHTVQNTSSPSRQLWLWTHPACYKDVLLELVYVFGVTMSAESMQDSEKTEAAKSEVDNKQNSSVKLKAKKVKSQERSNPVYSNGTVKVKSLKDTLCRFRLTGPASVSVLLEALLCADIEIPAQDDNSSHWWEKTYSRPAWKQAHTAQKALWEMMHSVGSPGELTPHSVLGLTVRDPRVFIPKKRTKVEVDAEAMGKYCVDMTLSWPHFSFH